MSPVLTVIIVVQWLEAGMMAYLLFLLWDLRMRARLRFPTSDSPLPCIGQRWQLQGVGVVQIVGVVVHAQHGYIHQVQYAYGPPGGDQWTGQALLGVFLASAQLIETPVPESETP